MESRFAWFDHPCRAYAIERAPVVAWEMAPLDEEDEYHGFWGALVTTGVGKSNGHGHVDPRLAARDVADEKLLAAIAKTPGLSRAEMCNRISRSPNTVKSTLQRLRDAGHIERDDDGAWKLVDQTEPAKPVPKWVKPLSVRSAPADA